MLPDKTIAYFCAEFAIDSNIPSYAGGLGVLAGDTMLEAAAKGSSMVGIGLLYLGRSFIQRFDSAGWQYEEPSIFQPDNTQALRKVDRAGKPLIIPCQMGEETVFLSAYQQRLGEKTTLYLLSTDLPENSQPWKDALSAEYYGAHDMQVRQQMVLGIGGVTLLSILGVKPHIYHFQEGRPIFAHWELVKEHVEKGESYENAVTSITQKTVYTNHTLVAAGNLRYDPSLLTPYATPYAQAFGIDVSQLVAPGIDDENLFSITKYAMATAKTVSAVSKLHGKLSKKEYPTRDWNVITNGVHLPRWQVYEYTNKGLDDASLWHVHMRQKLRLAETVRRRSGFSYDHTRLTIGWARRISGYKHVDALFSDITRLSAIVHDTACPVQILIAGKAHPGDTIAKESIQNVMKAMTHELSDHALFIPNYDLALASEMVAGVDVWLNTPEKGKEACGTSGMKALSNGVLNCTVLDGWAQEVAWEGVGWALDDTSLTESLYTTISTEVQPLYIKEESEGLKVEWIQRMKKSIALAQSFSTERMLEEYYKKLYS